MNLDYERDIEIDESALDVEWLRQPSLALKYARHLAKLNDEVRRLEERKKTKRSELINQVNSDPKAYLNKDKPNAADIEAYYRAHKDYITVVDDLKVAEAEREFAELAFKEISYTRKSALENLTKLFIANYFAGPAVPRDLSYERQQQERTKRVDSGIASGMKRGKK